MVCPNCAKSGSKVVDKRNNTENNSIRRRRECLHCEVRFTTYEKAAQSTMLVKKRSGRIEEYEREKLRNSILIAVKKRHIADEDIDKHLDKVEIKLKKKSIDGVIESRDIGEEVLSALKEIDQVAYMLYATVYKDFANLGEIEEALVQLKNQI
ncbi:MAG: transcriptional regulator NrdR [Candidatus Dojkabacteria bacterium]